MDVGIQMIFSSYGWPGMSDREAWQEEIRLARLADELGFDVIWSVEHHFFDYSFCPDNLQVMTYLASACPVIALGTVVTCDTQVGNGINFTKILPEDQEQLRVYLEAAEKSQ